MRGKRNGSNEEFYRLENNEEEDEGSNKEYCTVGEERTKEEEWKYNEEYCTCRNKEEKEGK